jgi:hypothetical protein
MIYLPNPNIARCFRYFHKYIYYSYHHMLPILTLLTSLFFVTSNYFPNLFEWWRQISEISNWLLVTPAWYAFAIWFPIFVWCILLGITAFKTSYSKKLLKWMSLVFILLGSWTTVVSFTDWYRLPPILFVSASIILLYSVELLRKIKSFQSWRQYRAILIPLFLFVWRSNSAFWLNFWTVATEYNLAIDQISLWLMLIVFLAAWHYATSIYFKLPLATILTYLRATIAIIVALFSQWTDGLLLWISIFHAIWLCVVSVLAVREKQF